MDGGEVVTVDAYRKVSHAIIPRERRYRMEERSDRRLMRNPLRIDYQMPDLGHRYSEDLSVPGERDVCGEAHHLSDVLKGHQRAVSFRHLPGEDLRLGFLGEGTIMPVVVIGIAGDQTIEANHLSFSQHMQLHLLQDLPDHE